MWSMGAPGCGAWATARHLGLSYYQLRNLLKKHGLLKAAAG